jgi:hypothetical protein
MKHHQAPKGMRRLYRYWILHALAASTSGELSVSDIHREVERNMGPQFTAREKADVPSGREPTWKNDIRQERRDMIENGWLANRSDGSWEISKDGGALLKRYGDAPKLGNELDEIG